MIRAYVTDDIIGLAVRISLVRHDAGGRPQEILRLLDDDPSSFQRFRWDPLDSAGADVAPTLVIGQDEARALLDALTRHFQGAGDTRALRRDYDRERDRVDKLLTHLAEVTKTLAGTGR